MGAPPPPQYQEGLVGTLADGGIVGAVDGRLAGEAGVKLADVFLRLLWGWGGDDDKWWVLPWVPPMHTLPTLPVPLSSPPPPLSMSYQAGFEGGVQPAGQQVLPVDVAEEGLLLRAAGWGGASGRNLGGGSSAWHPPSCLYLHIGCIARPPPNPLVGVSLEELEEKERRMEGGNKGRGGGLVGPT